MYLLTYILHNDGAGTMPGNRGPSSMYCIFAWDRLCACWLRTSKHLWL